MLSHYAECRVLLTNMLNVIAKRHPAECHYASCHYTKENAAVCEMPFLTAKLLILDSVNRLL
jgi:Zn-finger protein